jgi:hypothetical protein
LNPAQAELCFVATGSYSLAAMQRVAAGLTECPSKQRQPDPVLDRKLSGAEAQFGQTADIGRAKSEGDSV